MTGDLRACAPIGTQKKKKRVDTRCILASLRPPCITFERNPHCRQPRRTAGHSHPHRRVSIIRGKSRHFAPGLKIRGRSPLHRVRTRHQSSPHLTIRVTSRSTSLDHPKSRLGRRPMEQRRSPSNSQGIMRYVSAPQGCCGSAFGSRQEL